METVVETDHVGSLVAGFTLCEGCRFKTHSYLWLCQTLEIDVGSDFAEMLDI